MITTILRVSPIRRSSGSRVFPAPKVKLTVLPACRWLPSTKTEVSAGFVLPGLSKQPVLSKSHDSPPKQRREFRFITIGCMSLIY